MGLCTRSLVEHTETLSYLIHKSSEFLEEFKFADDDKQVIKKLENLRTNIAACFTELDFLRVKFSSMIPSPN